MPNCLTDPDENARPVEAVREDAYAAWLEGQDDSVKAWLGDSGFSGKGGQTALLPNADGLGGAVYVIGGNDGRGGPWAWASLFKGLSNGAWEVSTELGPQDAYDVALGFALASYKYDRYFSKSDEDDGEDEPKRTLVWPEACDRDAVRGAFGATKLVRDLINTPASDLGPAELTQAAQELAEASGAEFAEVVGVDLIREGFPAVYAVGRGAEENRAPRLAEFMWGPEDAPKVTLVGKGVTFDTGGLDIKPASAMKLMKKDMGGAAHALGLASMIMAAELNVRLRVIIAAVENSVSGAAMRPQDVIATRKGLSVEIGHTDAEGRVILADALALASEDQPDLILDFATLTGAARVALGTDLPALFCNDNQLAEDILHGGTRAADPVWPLPLHQPYKKATKSKVADLKNDTDGPYGGAIMAALFLEAFVGEGISWAHVDLMGWNLSTSPGKPEGGEAMSMRAMFEALKHRYGA
ncbi:leucyl aminopeptidase family protein [Magnetovibrio sp. PR-2]|uniref:leucyl aminopeptidase family protein n=1 Tax=Magnetovibrio sp. PR-2 TaxID=3120356 RepID=UPI002FCE1E54